MCRIDFGRSIGVPIPVFSDRSAVIIMERTSLYIITQKNNNAIGSGWEGESKRENSDNRKLFQKNNTINDYA